MGRHNYERKKAVPLTAATMLVTGVAAALAVPAFAGQPAPPEDTAPVQGEVVAALQRDLGLTETQVADRLRAEASAADAARSLSTTLGERYAGAWFDDAAGTLVVGVTEAEATAPVRQAGAQARVVEHGLAELRAAAGRLDRMGGAVPDEVTGWYVEPSSNSVVVEIDSTRRSEDADRLVGTLRAGGMPVRADWTTEAPRPLADIVGGDPFTVGAGRCSIGFSATGADGGEHFLTAGHCTEGGGTALDADGREIGPISESTFGAEGDFGLVDVTAPGATLTPLVNRYDGTTVEITGSEQAPVGASICRSGSTTGFFCGEVTAFDQTVNYGNGDIVSGLTRTTVCAEPGDSGGAYLSGTQAQGLTSGGSGDCTGGGVTFFQPVGEALDAFGLTLVTAGG
ncbi:S1 family peptidase [Prauserella muralis]|nr:S1 family peptidase [Prauserella muralis]TWE29710.1 streptogrisin C [Prauserella muralis]